MGQRTDRACASGARTRVDQAPVEAGVVHRAQGWGKLHPMRSRRIIGGGKAPLLLIDGNLDGAGLFLEGLGFIRHARPKPPCTGPSRSPCTGFRSIVSWMYDRIHLRRTAGGVSDVLFHLIYCGTNGFEDRSTVPGPGFVFAQL